MLAGYREPQRQLVAAQPGPYPGARTGRGELEQHGVGRLGVPVAADGEPPVAGPGDERGDAGVVGAGDQRAARPDPVDELREHRAVGLLGAVVVEVVGLDVGDHRDVRGEGSERAVALVRLDDEHVARAVVRPRPRRGQVAADGERRVEPAVLQRDGEHRRGRGLAVRARHGGDAAPVRQRGERLGPVHHGSPRSRAATSSGLSRGSRWRRRRLGRRRQVGRVVADLDARAERPQGEHRARVLGVRPGDRHPAGEQDAGDPAHPRTADADEVGPLPEPRHRHVRACRHGRAATASSTSRARRSSASAWPEARAACPPPPAGPRRPAAAPARPATRSPVSSASATSTPRRRDDRLGVERLLAVAVRQRHVHRRQADGRRSRRRSSPPTGTAPASAAA